MKILDSHLSQHYTKLIETFQSAFILPMDEQKVQSRNMQRIAFTMHIRPESEEEYRRRHQQVWPALLADLKQAGCQNYSIYLRGLELFAYMEVEDFPHFLERMAESEADKRWQQFMSDILIRETETDTGFPVVLEEVFHLG
jgi:L-rhamnose mutarotase